MRSKNFRLVAVKNKRKPFNWNVRQVRKAMSEFVWTEVENKWWDRNKNWRAAGVREEIKVPDCGKREEELAMVGCALVTFNDERWGKGRISRSVAVRQVCKRMGSGVAEWAAQESMRGTRKWHRESCKADLGIRLKPVADVCLHVARGEAIASRLAEKTEWYKKTA